MLGVFQKLVASKANDVYGFMLLRGILQYLPVAAYQQYMPTVWQLLFTRLQVGVVPGLGRFSLLLCICLSMPKPVWSYFAIILICQSQQRPCM